MSLATVLIADLKTRGHAIDQGLELSIRDALCGIMERDAEPKPVTDNGELAMALMKGGVDPTKGMTGSGGGGPESGRIVRLTALDNLFAEGKFGSGA